MENERKHQKLSKKQVTLNKRRKRLMQTIRMKCLEDDFDGIRMKHI